MIKGSFTPYPERPVRERGDSPREIISSVETLKTALAPISRGECSELPAREAPQSTDVSPWYGVYLWYLKNYHSGRKRAEGVEGIVGQGAARSSGSGTSALDGQGG